MSMKRDEIMKAVETLVKAVKTDEGRQIINELKINIVINNFNSDIENSSFKQINFEINDREKWRDIEGYDGDYQVSNLGNVRSRKHGEWRQLRKCISCGGYFGVSLSKNHQTKTYLVHRLVAKAFL